MVQSCSTQHLLMGQNSTLQKNQCEIADYEVMLTFFLQVFLFDSMFIMFTMDLYRYDPVNKKHTFINIEFVTCCYFDSVIR